MTPIERTLGPVTTPKRPLLEEEGRGRLYPYYAGFSYRWALDAIAQSAVCSTVVLDPFSGGGTTGVAAASRGVASLGFDMNPVAVTAALARTVPSRAIDAVSKLSPSLRAKTSAPPVGVPWLARGAASYLGALTQSLRDSAVRVSADSVVEKHLVAFANVVIFRSLRRLTRCFEGSNPTWVRTPSDARSKTRPSRDAILEIVAAELCEAISIAQQEPIVQRQPAFAIADARTLPLADASVDLVVTSPPYCTRIDYAVATARELDVLGVSPASVRALRNSLTGTTLNTAGRPATAMAASSAQVLESIRAHPARDSAGYYYNQFRQYLSDLTCALHEIARVLRPSGTCIVVAQDSFYRNIHINLADIITGEMETRGLLRISCRSVPVSRNLVTLNAKARATRGDSEVVESVLIFSKRAKR